MTVLILGATGATGRLLAANLLNRGHKVKAIVRTPESLPDTLRRHPLMTVVHANIADLGDEAMREQLTGCTAVASCLGHNMTVKGMFGAPRKLVTDATHRVCEAVRACQAKSPVKFVLMNTAGNSNRNLQEPVSFGERCVVGLIRLLLPPHTDNEQAADYLRTCIGPSDQAIEWSVVRPDTLLNETEVSEYTLHPSPTRSAIFHAGKTSRINVAHFMAELITDDDAWSNWKGQMPVIYNEGVCR